VPHRRFSWVNYALILLNAYFFYLELTLSPAALNQFVAAYAFTPARLSAALGGEEVDVANVALTIFTAMFLHGGWVHLLGNMLFLWIFGDNVEDALGHFTYLISYLAFGVAATLTHFLIDPFSSIPALGASGAIAGVLGFYLILYPGARVLSLIPILIFFWLVRVPAAIFLFVWFIFQTFGGVAAVGQQVGGGVAYWAHIGRFLAGVALGVLFRILSKQLPNGTYRPRWERT
jgi:membrane associated rhomboid family serine protease